MSEKKQDRRPVFMGTFEKFSKSVIADVNTFSKGMKTLLIIDILLTITNLLFIIFK